MIKNVIVEIYDLTLTDHLLKYTNHLYMLLDVDTSSIVITSSTIKNKIKKRD